MRLLFAIDRKDYAPGGTVFSRPSVRGIIRSGQKLAMVHSGKYDYCKFPGGGIEPGEAHQQTLMREVREETGLIVIPESIREFGLVHRAQKGKSEDIFIQDNYYYLCEVEEASSRQQLDDYEHEERFSLRWLTIEQAMACNQRALNAGRYSDSVLLERELGVLALLRSQQTSHPAP